MFTKKNLCIFMAVAIPVLACGPYFSNAILPGTRTFTSIPLASWNRELAKIKSTEKKYTNIKEVNKRGDLYKEFESAVKYYNLKSPEKILDEYKSVRERIEKHRKALKEVDSDEKVKFPKLLIPESLPEEYRLYLDGAINFYEGHLSIAKKKWTQLLQLPKNERLYRTIWARYMLAEISLGENEEEFLNQYKLLR